MAGAECGNADTFPENELIGDSTSHWPNLTVTKSSIGERRAVTAPAAAP